jgi:hypothetical protein
MFVEQLRRILPQEPAMKKLQGGLAALAGANAEHAVCYAEPAASLAGWKRAVKISILCMS